MFRRDAFSFGFNAALGVALLALLLMLGWRLLEAVVAIGAPFIGGVVVSLMLDPLVTLFQSRVTRGNRPRAVMIVFLLFLLFFAGLFTFVVPNLVDQTQRLVRWFSPVTYRVRRASSEEDAPRYVTVAEGLSQTTFTVPRLVNGVTYRFIVFAVNPEGGETPSDVVTVTPSKDSPENPQAAPTSGEAQPATPTDKPDNGSAENPSTTKTETEGGAEGQATTEAEKEKPSAPRDLEGFAGDGKARLVWKAPRVGQSGFDKLRTQIDRWLLGHRRIGPIQLPENLESITAQYSDQIAQALKVSAGRAGDIVLGSVARLLDIVLIPIIAVYILSDLGRLRARLFFLLPDKARAQALTVAREVGGVFGNYVRGLVTICALYGAASMVSLLALSFWFPSIRGYALLLGFAAGVLYAVPYVGALVTVLLAGVGALSTGGGTTAVLVSVILLVALNQIFDNVLMPRIVGGGVGLHPLLSLFALILGGRLFGLWGMLLSVPVAASIQVVLFRLYPRLAAPVPLSLMMDMGSNGDYATRRRAQQEKALAAEQQLAEEELPVAGSEVAQPVGAGASAVQAETSEAGEGDTAAPAATPLPPAPPVPPVKPPAPSHRKDDVPPPAPPAD